ncbi:hypothetical protein BZA77DRAFT_319453 [Pyronema omphalodes]|nr:hypothetical protein BZA77DRAFT_319453 [Pyronema omphalodes]
MTSDSLTESEQLLSPKSDRFGAAPMLPTISAAAHITNTAPTTPHNHNTHTDHTTTATTITSESQRNDLHDVANAIPTTAVTPVHARPLPTLNVQSPDAQLSTTMPPRNDTTALTPSGEEGQAPQNMPSTPGSPPAVISTATTPVIPLSASKPQRNPFPASPLVGLATAGTKRTASGTMKSMYTENGSPVTPASPSTPGCLRSQSAVDTSPRNVAQLSSQLRTRLTYALLKIQNNWTSESLDQIEARVSQGQISTSPRVRIKRENSIGGDDHGYDQSVRHHHHRTNSDPSSAYPLSQNHPSGIPGNRTYESFWREHGHNPITKTLLQAKSITPSNTARYPTATSAHQSRSGLQPPAQIIPDRDRRSYGYSPHRQPPCLHHSISNQSQVSTGSSIIPATPPLTTQDAQRTMEQDAVESLMFLSSPGHSQRRVSISHSQSHLRALADVVVENSGNSLNSGNLGTLGNLGSLGTLASPQLPTPERHNYSRNATTWPRSRKAYKQPRTALGALRSVDSGVGFEDDLTDDDGLDDYQSLIDKGKGREEKRGHRQPDNSDIVIAAAS